MNGKHTITQNDWWNYPVLKKGYKVPFFYKKKSVEVKIMTGYQDEIPVLGVIYRIKGTATGCGGGGCLPGRKWGEFDSLKEAELFGVEYTIFTFEETLKNYSNLSNRLKPVIEALLRRKIELIQGVQVSFQF